MLLKPPEPLEPPVLLKPPEPLLLPPEPLLVPPEPLLLPPELLLLPPEPLLLPPEPLFVPPEPLLHCERHFCDEVPLHSHFWKQVVQLLVPQHAGFMVEPEPPELLLLPPEPLVELQAVVHCAELPLVPQRHLPQLVVQLPQTCALHPCWPKLPMLPVVPALPP